jgi:Spy/CpxP family protein refolding chaperone
MKIATRALAGLCLAVVVAAPAGPAAARQEPPKAQQQDTQGSADRRFWWKDADTVKEIGLSRRQSNRIEEIWKASAPSLRGLHKELNGLEAEFNRLMAENTAEERVIMLQIDRVEAVRSQINKSRTLMLYRMHQVLTPVQYQRLTQILERQRKERGRR